MPDSQVEVLVLDADDAARAAVEGALRRQGHAVQGFGNADQAFDAAIATPFQVMVVADKQVVLDAPGFLRRLAQKNVTAPAVVIGSAQTTSDRIFEALRAGAVEFVRKPLAPEPFLGAVNRAITIAARRASGSGAAAARTTPFIPEPPHTRRPAPLPAPLVAIADGLASRTIEIPAVPTVVSELRRATRDPRTSLDDVARLIQRDQSLSLDVLKIANSAAYIRGSRTSDIKTALGRIGLKQVDTLIETVFLRGFYQPHLRVFKDLLGSVWRYSVASAIAMRLLAENHGSPAKLDPGVAYAAGLFRDVGASFLIWLVSERAANVDVNVFIPFVRERHEAAGAQILATWSLDAAIPQLAATHHVQSPPLGASLYWSIAAVATELADLAVSGGDLMRTTQRGAAFAGACADSLHITEGTLRKVQDQLSIELNDILTALE
jgi:HD-like signal output (HDOD) protein/DNA-binding NarL/FixJ family response regulator